VHLPRLLQDAGPRLEALGVHSRGRDPDASLPRAEPLAHGSARVKVGVAGLWHLGSVTAACLASAGHEVIAFDASPDAVARLEAGQPPVSEPGLQDLMARGVAAGSLCFSSRPEDLAASDIAWITYD